MANYLGAPETGGVFCLFRRLISTIHCSKPGKKKGGHTPAKHRVKLHMNSDSESRWTVFYCWKFRYLLALLGTWIFPKCFSLFMVILLLWKNMLDTQNIYQPSILLMARFNHCPRDALSFFYLYKKLIDLIHVIFYYFNIQWVKL